MQSRRDILKKLGLASASVAACTSPVEAFARAGSSREPPWWLLHPLEKGTSVGLGWRIASLSPVERGAAVLELVHRGGATMPVHICARMGRKEGVVSSGQFDLILMDGGNGGLPTNEKLGRVLKGLARRIRRNEELFAHRMKSVRKLLTHQERVLLYGPRTLV